VGRRFCHSKFFAVLMPASIIRSEFMSENALGTCPVACDSLAFRRARLQDLCSRADLATDNRRRAIARVLICGFSIHAPLFAQATAPPSKMNNRGNKNAYGRRGRPRQSQYYRGTFALRADCELKRGVSDMRGNRHYVHLAIMTALSFITIYMQASKVAGFQNVYVSL
jgi:hypothetical protein